MAFRGNLGRLGAAALTVAALAAGTVFAGAPVHAQAPVGVPSARFYGHVTPPSGALPAGSAVTATVGGVACSGGGAVTGSVATGALDNLNNYTLDIQAVPGCTTPGASVTFTLAGLRANQTGTLPQVPGTAVHLDLTFAQATPTATAAPPPPPPPTPTRAASPAPTSAPPPPPPTQAPRPPVTATPARVQAPVAQAPKGPVTAQAPRAGAAPAAAAPRLPSTGTGGLLDEQSSTSLTGWALALIVLAALGVSASGVVAYRRSR